MSDIQRYGSGEIGGDYYYVREFLPTPGGMTPAAQAAVVFIDDLGGRHKVGSGTGGWSPEEIGELPTLDEATATHLEPAFEKAERNRQKWLKGRKDVPAEPAPEPISPATQRFLCSDDEPV